MPLPHADAPKANAPDFQAIRELAQDCYDSYLADLGTLVNIDCGTFIPAGVNQVADLMAERFGSDGWSVERISQASSPAGRELADRYGDILIATLEGSPRAGERGGRVLIVGHMDTVFDQGTAAARPFRTEGQTAYGPGVSDMKGGLLAGLYAVRCLRQAGFEDFARITYVCNPDEEVGSPFSGATILERAAEADVCFVLEGARENGDIVSARKGVADFRIDIRGRAAHAGVEPERGRSAILQAAHTTVALHALNGRWPSVTVNVGMIRGGIRPNVVAEGCELAVDVRATTRASFEEAIAAVTEAAHQLHVPDVEIEVVSRGGFPPMEKTESTARLVERARAIAAELDFDVKDAATGGASDANPVAGMGVPTLDGLGPIGGADHAPGEWLDLASVVPRMALLAGLIATSP
jgi:glutamate carboxypeptidase